MEKSGNFDTFLEREQLKGRIEYQKLKEKLRLKQTDVDNLYCGQMASAMLEELRENEFFRRLTNTQLNRRDGEFVEELLQTSLEELDEASAVIKVDIVLNDEIFAALGQIESHHRYKPAYSFSKEVIGFGEADGSVELSVCAIPESSEYGDEAEKSYLLFAEKDAIKRVAEWRKPIPQIKAELVRLSHDWNICYDRLRAFIEQHQERTHFNRDQLKPFENILKVFLWSGDEYSFRVVEDQIEVCAFSNGQVDKITSIPRFDIV